jgi:hypothetical protein
MNADTKLRAFHGDPAIKEKYLDRVRQHIAADDLIRGTGWRGGSGCAVGCTLHAYEHHLYETELGIPEWLARLEDTLFENMSFGKSRTWPLAFLEAANTGSDLNVIKGPLLIFVLERALTRFDNEQFPDVVAAINGSIALWRRDDVGSVFWNRAAARAAAWAAAAAASASARAAAEAAARAAVAAWAASEAARAAAEASARAAARAAAWAAAEAAAAAAEYDAFADHLLMLMREAT